MTIDNVKIISYSYKHEVKYIWHVKPMWFFCKASGGY